MGENSKVFIGLDTTLKISVAVADGERSGEVRFLGDISSDPTSVASMVNKLAKRGSELNFAMRAGQRGTSCTARFSPWAMTVWWWPHRWCPSGQATG